VQEANDVKIANDPNEKDGREAIAEDAENSRSRVILAIDQFAQCAFSMENLASNRGAPIESNDSATAARTASRKDAPSRKTG